MRKKTLLCLVLLLVSVSAKDYEYDSISIEALVLNDSRILVNETWNMSFEGPFSYGYRYFLTDPVRVRDFRVYSGGRRLNSERVSGGSRTEYKWSIDVTDSNETYLLEYELLNAFQSEEDYDLLYYTVVFGDREKPVGEVSFDLTFPKRINLANISHRVTHGSLEQSGPRTISLDYGRLPPDTPLDLELKLPKGLVGDYFDWTRFIFSLLISVVFGGGFVVSMFLLLATFWQVYDEWRKHGRDPEVVHDSRMLAKLKPAVAGFIVDEKAGVKEVIATIIDLAVRGYVRINEKEGLFGLFKDLELVRLKSDYSRLEEYERKLMKKLFKGKERVKISDLRYKFYEQMDKIKDLIALEAFQEGLFDGDPEKVRKKYSVEFKDKLAIVFVLMVLFFLFQAFFGSWLEFWVYSSVLLFSRVFTMVGLILAIFSLFFIEAAAGFMPRKSEKGVRMRKKYRDLKDWMAEYPLKEERLFDEFLPYAIAFGIGDKWVKKMEDLSGEIDRDWYGGTFSSAAYASMYSSFNTGLASSPSSSGGGGSFGGGGGAGGGGGGFG